MTPRIVLYSSKAHSGKDHFPITQGPARNGDGMHTAAVVALARLRHIQLFFILLPCLFHAGVVHAQERHVFQDTPVRQVLEYIETVSPYRFLYRDALITGKRVSFDAAADNLVAALTAALRPYHLQLQVDESRHQILLSEIREKPVNLQKTTLMGQVIDDQSGARLPFATVTWNEDGRIRGVAANAAGTFQLPLAPALLDRGNVLLTASYVGYQARQVRVDINRLPATLPIRLAPDTFLGHEIVVSSLVLDAKLDTTWRHLIQPGLFSPLGESSVYRSLQSLPSVSFSTAFTQGLNVRGSKADGFQVLLDGIPIYNQNHFFGLFDAFNKDALQTVAFHYGVTPADFQGPPGGTLSFVTRTGSQTEKQMIAGLSNTAINATLEGPLLGGRGSWLVSGRHSYLDAVNWFNNADLIAQGLDVNRATDALPRPGPGAVQRALTLGSSSALFYDVHTKLYLESESGNRLMGTFYLGGDRTLHTHAERAINMGAQGNMGGGVERVPVDTRNTWRNAAASLHDQRTLRPNIFGHSLLAFSDYHSRFHKDDFLYQTPNRPPPDSTAPGPGNAPPQLAPFEDGNDLMEWKMAQYIDMTPSFGGTISTGYDVHLFTITYRENSILRNAYSDTRHSTQVDVFAQYDRNLLSNVELHAGLRSHYFSQGDFFRLSPRLRFRFWPRHTLSWSLGYSRNYQFLHRLYLEHAKSSDVWVMSTKDQPPGSVDNVTAGLYVKASPTLFFQAEVYYKRYRNLRQHESIVASRHIRPQSILLTPWLSDNNGRAKGLEIMLRHRIGTLLWTHSYTLSRMEIQNDVLNDGVAFPADWDRRHQFTTYVQGNLNARLTWHLTWLIASGTPNSLAYTMPSEPTLLPAYHRMDASLTYRRSFNRVLIDATASIFNLYNRKNTWYRTPITVIDPSPPRPRVDFVNVNVYDLGFQPSFSLSATF